MSVTVRIMPGELSCALVGKQGGGPGASSLSIPRVTQEEAIPLHGVHLVEVTLPLHQHRTLWAPLSCPAYQYSNKDSGLIDPSVLNSTTKWRIGPLYQAPPPCTMHADLHWGNSTWESEQKTSTNPSPTPNLLIIECWKTSPLEETGCSFLWAFFCLFLFGFFVLSFIFLIQKEHFFLFFLFLNFMCIFLIFEFFLLLFFYYVVLH